ncbi:hypothetical protein V2A60_002120 [Cordyceps javanica]
MQTSQKEKPLISSSIFRSMQALCPLVLGVLASQALGAPTVQPAADHVVNANWGGAVLEGKGYDYVTGVLTVPAISGQAADASASIWVGIDGNDCHTAILQTGITVFGDGSLHTWAEWWQYDAEAYPGAPLAVGAGDALRLTVHATSRTSGTTTVENLTRGGSRTKTFSSVTPYPLCETDAEWIVEDYKHNGRPVDFVDFGRFAFADAYARNGAGQAVTPEGAQILNVRIDGGDRTRCASDRRGVYCSYVRDFGSQESRNTTAAEAIV